MISQNQRTELLDPALHLAVTAGRAIMEVYQSSDFEVEHKADKSPLTLADRRSHDIIDAGLGRLTPGVPILSEEGRDVPYTERADWSEMWLVDPLDGTKEFVKKNGEFSVNIALIQHGEPVLGVIYAPARGDAYVGLVPTVTPGTHNNGEPAPAIPGGVPAYPAPGAWKMRVNGAGDPGSPARGIHCRAREQNHMTIIASRSHMTDATRLFIREATRDIEEWDVINIGSALKLCWLAEGRADLYPRNAPTMEWDTGAGHALVRAAGGEVWELASAAQSREAPPVSTGRPLRYNKENLLNPHFVARAWE